MIQVFFSFGSKCVLLENSLTPLEGGRGKGGGGGERWVNYQKPLNSKKARKKIDSYSWDFFECDAPSYWLFLSHVVKTKATKPYASIKIFSVGSHTTNTLVCFVCESQLVNIETGSGSHSSCVAILFPEAAILLVKNKNKNDLYYAFFGVDG